MNNLMRRALALTAFAFSTMGLFAGGSGLNLVVVVNQSSANSVQLGNYYCEKRGVPPQNVLRINWTGGIVSWTRSEFDSNLRAPLTSLLASRQLSNQVEYVLLSMDIPYRVTESTGLPATSGVNSTTSALYSGFKPDGLCPTCPPGYPSCSLAPASASLYAGSEGVFRQTPPLNASSNSWLVMMLTSSNLAQAKLVVDRGRASDSSVPTQTVYLIHYDTDPFRGVRYRHYDDSIFDNRLLGVARVVRTNTYWPGFFPNQLGSQFGFFSFPLPADLFVPGALADNLTSFGGTLFENTDHTGPMIYLGAGATASYGTVVEPCNYYEKFPSPRVYYYQARGFNAAESYYQSVTNPYQGVLVGEPLAAPFAAPCTGAWSGLPAEAELAGTTNLSVQFTAAEATRPVQQMDLFLDGTFLMTLTNIPPRTNNLLYVWINGFPTNYTVPANASLRSVASNLAVRLNNNTYSNATKVAARACGDRIELQSLAPLVPGSAIPVAVSNHMGTANALTTFLAASRTNFLESVAQGYSQIAIGGTVVSNDYLQVTVTKTNGSQVTVSVTNYLDGVSLDQFVRQFMNAINATASLQGSDGVVAEDLVPDGALPFTMDFDLRARGEGPLSAQIQAFVEGTFSITPVGTVTLEDNRSDLFPRNHLYVTAGLTNLPLTFGFNTTTQADGFHELTAVAYEGSHVRTQKRILQSVRIQNTTLSATFTCLLGDTNTALEATLQFAVVANTNNITRIELFGTGGSLAISNNMSAATFLVAATNLGIGLHPFYALVTRADNKLYRTPTKWIRIVGPEPPFALSVLDLTPTVGWPASAGRRYEVWSATAATGTFTLRDAVTPTNSAAQWSETNTASPQRLYRVRATP